MASTVVVTLEPGGGPGWPPGPTAGMSQVLPWGPAKPQEGAGEDTFGDAPSDPGLAPATFATGYVSYAAFVYEFPDPLNSDYTVFTINTWSEYQPQFYFGVWGDAGNQPTGEYPDDPFRPKTSLPSEPAPPGCGVLGSSSSGSGVVGISRTPTTPKESSAGVYGVGPVGVYGSSQEAASPDSPNLPSLPPGPVGVFGDSSLSKAKDSQSGIGVFGKGAAAGVSGTGSSAGVLGQSQSGLGVHAVGGAATPTTSPPDPQAAVFAEGGPGSGVFAQSQSGIGVHAVGGAATPTTSPPDPQAAVFAEGGPGTGVYGSSSGGAEGGVFQSVSGAQLRLVPSTTPLLESPLMQTGQVGDLYLYSVAQEVGTSGTYDYQTILWLCIEPNDVPGGTAAWAQVQLGDVVGGGLGPTG